MSKKLLPVFKPRFVRLLVLAALLAIGIFCVEHNFIAKGNIRQLAISMTVPGIMLAGAVPLLIAGEIDMASGAEAALGATIFAELLSNVHGMPWTVALLVALAAGAVMGFINYLIVNKLGFMSFIATVGMMNIWGGIANIWTRSNNIDVNNASLNAIGKGVLFGRLPYLFIFMVVVIIVYGWMLHSTVFGRGIYTIGGNRECARLAGVNIDRTQLVLFINSAMISVLAGVVWVAYKRMSSAGNIIGSGANYDALTAAILGGVAFAGGSGGMAGAFAAVVMVCVFYNGLTILGLPTYLSVPMQGLLLIIALILDYLVTGRSRKLRIKIKRN